MSGQREQDVCHAKACGPLYCRLLRGPIVSMLHPRRPGGVLHALSEAVWSALGKKQKGAESSHQCPVVGPISNNHAWDSGTWAHAVDCTHCGVAATNVISDDLQAKAHIRVKEQIRYSALLCHCDACDTIQEADESPSCGQLK